MPPGTYWLSVGAWLRRQRPLLPPLASHSLRCDGGSWVVDSHPFCLCWWTKWTPLPTSVCPTPIYILMRRLLPLLQWLGMVWWYYVNFYTQIVYILHPNEGRFWTMHILWHKPTPTIHHTTIKWGRSAVSMRGLWEGGVYLRHYARFLLFWFDVSPILVLMVLFWMPGTIQ